MLLLLVLLLSFVLLLLRCLFAFLPLLVLLFRCISITHYYMCMFPSQQGSKTMQKALRMRSTVSARGLQLTLDIENGHRLTGPRDDETTKQRKEERGLRIRVPTGTPHAHSQP